MINMINKLNSSLLKKLWSMFDHLLQQVFNHWLLMLKHFNLEQ